MMKLSDKTKGLLTEIFVFSNTVNANRLNVYAGSVAFCIFISFIPFLLILISAVALLPFSQNEIELLLTDVVPSEYRNFTHGLLTELYSNHVAAFSISIVATFWAAGRGILGITQGLNEIANVKESRNFIVMRFRSILYTILLLFALIFLLILVVFSNDILSVVDFYFHIPNSVTSIMKYKNIFVYVLLFFLYLYMFVALPNCKEKVREQIPGAFVASFIWFVFTKLFSFYIARFNSYTVYGSFAVVIITGVWLYTGMYIMFMGAQLNHFLTARKGIVNERFNK